MSRIHSITQLTGAPLVLLLGTSVYATPPPVAGLIAFSPIQLKDSDTVAVQFGTAE